MTSDLSHKVAELEAANARLTRLLEASREIALDSEPLRLAVGYCGFARTLVPAQFSAVGLLDDSGQSLQHFALSGDDGEEFPLAAKPGLQEGVFGSLLREPRPARYLNPDGDPAALGFPEGYPPVHSLLALPLVTPRRVYGFLLFANKTGGREFDDEDERTAVALASHAAVAYENALRYDRTLHELRESKAELLRGHEELQRQYLKIQEVNRLKSEFLANMSHELRTPLNAIIGFSELMRDGKLGPIAEPHKEYLDDILSSARHLLHLIEDVLELAKIEAGKAAFQPRAVALEPLALEVREAALALAGQKPVSIEVEVDPAAATAVVDPRSFKQVLYNFVSNAVKFTAKSGRVFIRIAAEEPDRLRIEVRDTGIGIRSEDLPRLFVPFEQLDAGTAKQYGGAGLGLALAKRIVEALGGRVGLESVPGQGSTFYAVLPQRS
ncbi:MAG TPA: GAF domain-containing sensor histidine kinase [candidate division Zixibacteria bacterium]|nr:GAF domain-containing sensor histidine kinase [candidate division Zixibacteria bacterium]